MRPLALSAFGLLLASCGYVGDPLPPALKIPKPIVDLSVAQVGPYLETSFTLPVQTMEELNLERLGKVELKVSDAWPEGGQSIDVAPGETGPKIPVKDWVGKEVVIAVRTANSKLRFSPWSNLIRLRVAPEIAQPSDLLAKATASGVELSWSAPTQPGVAWKVYRLGTVSGPSGQMVVDKEPIELAKVNAPRFLDRGAEFGARYRYTLQGVFEGATSLMSASVEITPEDRFAPAAPQGLTALSGSNAVQLSWERNAESDVAYYRLFRAVGDGPFALLGDRLSSSTYSDFTAQPGQRLRYAVTAMDRNNNESSQSKEVEITVP